MKDPKESGHPENQLRLIKAALKVKNLSALTPKRMLQPVKASIAPPKKATKNQL
jgi:hypothetical protein